MQRGSVFFGEGDPLTPNFPSDAGGLRLTDAEAHEGGVNGTGAGWALPSIPSIPISYGDAGPLMDSIAAGTGPSVAAFDASWQGGMAMAYAVGPAACHCRVKTNNAFERKAIWNVLGRVRGSVEPDRIVVLGNHRDAWVGGGVDPVRGCEAGQCGCHSVAA